MAKNTKLLFLVITIAYLSWQVEAFENFQPEPISVFKDESSLYSGKKNVDHLFSLLSDVHTNKNDSNFSEMNKSALLEQDSKISINNELNLEHEQNENALYYDDHAYEMNDEVGEESYYMSTIKLLLRKGFTVAGHAKNVFDTVQKVTTIYRDQRQKILSNKTILNSIGIHTNGGIDNNDVDVAINPNATAVDTLIGVVLDPKSMSKIFEVGRLSENEDQILEGLTSVLLGHDGRSSGSALTLDPVTIIALLTLAAYLIRAVYQILANNNNAGRLLEDEQIQLPFGLSDLQLPEVLVRVHSYIAGSDYSRMGFGRSLDISEDDDMDSENRIQHTDNGVLAFPGSVAALSKLLKEGRDGCIRLYVCEQLAKKNPLAYSIEDLLVGGLGYYLADADLWKIVATLHEDADTDSCITDRQECQQGVLAEARQLRNLFTEASLKFLRLWTRTRAARMRSLARDASKQL